MLVLSRKKNESIVINDDITVVVVEIRGDKVRLGIEMPSHNTLHRREVYDALMREHGTTPQTTTILLSEEATKAVKRLYDGKDLSSFVSSLIVERARGS